MGRTPCCEKVGLKRGRWTAKEDDLLTNYIRANGEGSWRSLPKKAGMFAYLVKNLDWLYIFCTEISLTGLKSRKSNNI